MAQYRVTEVRRDFCSQAFRPVSRREWTTYGSAWKSHKRRCIELQAYCQYAGGRVGQHDWSGYYPSVDAYREPDGSIIEVAIEEYCDCGACHAIDPPKANEVTATQPSSAESGPGCPKTN